jgi:hypothetical protein
MGPLNPAALAEAQSASEVFDVMAPPPPDGSFDIYSMKPTPRGQGLTLAHFTAQLEDLRDTSLTLELNGSTFGILIWVIWGTK